MEQPFIHPFFGAVIIPFVLMLIGAIAKANMDGRSMKRDDWVMGVDFCLLACAIGMARMIELLNQAHQAQWILDQSFGKNILFTIGLIVVPPFWTKIVMQAGWIAYPQSLRQQYANQNKSLPTRYVITVNLVGALPFVSSAAFLLR